MKKIYYILLLPVIALLGACSDDVVDDLSGTFDDVQRIDFSSEKTLPTDKLKKGIKSLNMEFAADANTTLALSVYSTEWTLQPGSYSPVANPSDAPKNMQYTATVNAGGQSVALASGTLEVSKFDETYIISGMFTGADSKRYVLNFRGPIEFEIGVDDPEASGYTITMKADPVTITDYTTWQTVVVPGVNKYTITVSDPNGADAAFFEAINKEGLDLEQLMGTYTIAVSPAEPWLIDNGWLVPDYGMAGGAFVVANGEKQYITAGKVTFSSVTGIDGSTLFNFSGEGLKYITVAGGSGDAALNIRFCSYLKKSGTELKDLSFTSQVLGRDVKYSVLLPDGYDASKEYPVLYLLHGAGGGNNDWLDAGGIASHIGSVENKMVIVMPQASFEGFDSFYLDNYAGKGMNYETFFITEFMPAMEQTYKCNGKRGLAGLSMGGYGTLYYGLKYADKFCGMYACSPALAMDGIPSIFDMIWTPGAAPFTVEMGTEDFLYEGAKGLNEAMQFSPLLPGFTYVERPGAHDWPFWCACAPKFVKFFDERFSN